MSTTPNLTDFLSLSTQGTQLREQHFDCTYDDCVEIMSYVGDEMVRISTADPTIDTNTTNPDHQRFLMYRKTHGIMLHMCLFLNAGLGV